MKEQLSACAYQDSNLLHVLLHVFTSEVSPAYGIFHTPYPPKEGRRI